jgi:uncharacterized protein (TIGR02217 family)
MNAPLRPGQIEHWPLARLKPYARNAKTHDADQVAKIAASMAEFGWTVPVLVAADGELIAGHGRVLAAAHLGLSEAPVFEARGGRLHGFRTKDWADYKSCLPSQEVGPTDQPIGTGNGAVTTFALLKCYTSGAQSWTRAIAKPVAGSVRLALNGVEQMSGWSVDTATGSVTFAAAPGAGIAITAGFEFDVPVRFDTDMLDVTLDIERLGSITSIPLLEIRR